MNTVAASPIAAERHEQSRARYPDTEGYVERDGVKTFYEVYGEGEPTVLLLPTWSIIHSRCWKMQIPYLARHCRVIAFDGRGNGKSDRPAEPRAYVEQEFADDALAVMDATGTDRAVLVSLSRGAERSLLLATGHPDRVAGMVFIAPALPLHPAAPRASAEREFTARHESYSGWEKWNANYWLENYRRTSSSSSSRRSSPSRTPPSSARTRWPGRWRTDPETLVATQLAPRLADEATVRELTSRVSCPTLVIHGHDDAVRPHDSGAALAELTGGALVASRARGRQSPTLATP